MRFFNSTQNNMSFVDVIACIKYFIKTNPDCKYTLSVGTDSQVKGNRMCFATGIHIHRIGQGAWCCISKRMENRNCIDVRDRIAQETAITHEVASILNDELINTLCGISAKYKNFEIKLEAHIDIGQLGETRKLIKEMCGYFGGSDIDTKIKPDFFAASSHANEFCKKVKAG